MTTNTMRKSDAAMMLLVEKDAHARTLAALEYLAAHIPLGTLNIRKDFSLMNAHAGAMKAIVAAKATGI